MSCGCMVSVPTMAWYSGLSLPTLICCPCFVVRPAFMMKRFCSILVRHDPAMDVIIMDVHGQAPGTPALRDARAQHNTRDGRDPLRTPCRLADRRGCVG